MASRQVMRSVSADFCASAGAAVASVMQAASSVPPSQVSDRICLVLSIPKNADDAGNMRRRGTLRCRGTEATRMPSPWLRTAAAPLRSLPKRWRAHLSLLDGREQPFQENVDGLRIDPAKPRHEVALGIDIDHVGAIADVGKSGGRSTRPALPVGVEKPVHVTIDRLGLGRRQCAIDPLLREQLTILPLA